MAVKFLDFTGLQKFWTKCKNAFVAKDSSGNVTVTGKVTAKVGSFENAVWIRGGGAVAFQDSQELQGYETYVRVDDNGNMSLTKDGNTAIIATQAFVTSAVANAGHLKREKVDALPGVATAKENVIYMVSNSTTGDNKFDEYMLIDGAWERTGSSDVDLSGYANEAITEAEINSLT